LPEGEIPSSRTVGEKPGDQVAVDPARGEGLSLSGQKSDKASLILLCGGKGEFVTERDAWGENVSAWVNLLVWRVATPVMGREGEKVFCEGGVIR